MRTNVRVCARKTYWVYIPPGRLILSRARARATRRYPNFRSCSMDIVIAMVSDNHHTSLTRAAPRVARNKLPIMLQMRDASDDVWSDRHSCVSRVCNATYVVVKMCASVKNRAKVTAWIITAEYRLHDNSLLSHCTKKWLIGMYISIIPRYSARNNSAEQYYWISVDKPALKFDATAHGETKRRWSIHNHQTRRRLFDMQ